MKNSVLEERIINNFLQKDIAKYKSKDPPICPVWNPLSNHLDGECLLRDCVKQEYV